jgi:hypothetical protein
MTLKPSYTETLKPFSVLRYALCSMLHAPCSVLCALV